MTSPKPVVLLTVEDLPNPLQFHVREFAIEHHHLQSPEAAKGECVSASDTFITMLFKKREYKLFRVEEVSWRFDEDGELEEDSWPDIPHEHFWDNGYGGHTAILAHTDDGSFIIDFTARQFGEGVPFPLIWRNQ